MTICSNCGQMNGVKSYDEALWELYWRRKDGRQNIEPLVFTQSDLDEDPDWYNDRENSGPWVAMEYNMASRGLCPECSRPNLIGMTEDDFYSPEDMDEMNEVWAIEAAERRMGC